MKDASLGDMYSIPQENSMCNAELFIMAAAPEAVKEVFLSGVTLSIQDDAAGCVDLDAEKERLSRIWDVARMDVRQLVDAAEMTQSAFAKGAGIPLRTVQDWCGGRRSCPVWVRFLLAEHYKLL